jgi:SRSO17 transposase
VAAIADLGDRLERYWRYYGQDAKTRTHDTRAYGLAYLSGLLRLDAKRNMAHIARQTGISEQNMQHFISESPWSGREVIARMQAAVAQRGELAGGVLIIDESADEKAGEMSAGAGRQHNGRLGKVDQCQVGVFAADAKGHHWTWVDGVLFLPEKWFSDAYADRRRKVGIPPTRLFQTKIQLAWQLIEQVQARGLPFVAVAFDSLYGRNATLRDQCQAAGIEYYADIPCDWRVYDQSPQVIWPLTKSGRRAKRHQVANATPMKVEQLLDDDQTTWHTITLRPSARGLLVADFARRQVWTVRPDGTVRPETLLIRRDAQDITYSLTNAPTTTLLPTLAERKSQRYFVERSIQDAKSELGWDEFQAIKYRAWEHQLALTILASWFITETRLDWEADHPRNPALVEAYELDDLPALSVANVRELLKAALPLPQLSPAEAAVLVVKHLDNRTRSRRSRLKMHSGP